MNRRSRLIEEVEDLVRVLQQQPTGDVDAVLSEVVAGAVRSVPHARHAGITLAREGAVGTAAATGPYPVLLDEVQQRHAEGPCLSAAWHQHVIRIDNMALETRWPAYTVEALERTPIRSVASFQLFTERPRIGALNLYAEHPDAFDDESVELGLIYATYTTLAWNLVRRESQFRSALASRDIIGQAKGMIMERFAIDAAQAFEMLTRLSQTGNLPLAELARKLVHAERPDR
jgi:hypothetical protein